MSTKILESDAQYRERLIDAIPAGAVYTAEDIGNSVGDYLDKIGAAFGCLRHGVAIDEARKLNGAPKNDKARKAWLAGLKDGDEVANITDDGRVLGFGPVHRSQNGPYFLFGAQVGCRSLFTVKSGKAQPAHWHAEGWIVQKTPGLVEQHKLNVLARAACVELGRMSEYQWRQLPTDKILAVSAILWPEQAK